MRNSYFLYTVVLLLLAVQSAGSQELNIHGFVEGAYGVRVDDNDLLEGSEFPLGEARTQLQLSHYGESAEFYGAVDFIGDQVDRDAQNLNIREAYMQFRLGKYMDAKVGRQVLTWGTGDLLFINDIFPKDYQSFFIGREDQYLKLPNDALRVRFFTGPVNIDVVGIPFFDPDRLPTGKRLSYFNPLANGTVGVSNLPAPMNPERTFDNAEAAVRLYRYLGNYQVSGYVFRGFYKDPMGVEPFAGYTYYPELSVYGSSLRGALLSGVLSAEYGYYDSREDGSGDDPMIPNSQHRYLVGYERQWWSDFTLGLQYYGEYMVDHDTYTGTLPQGAPELDELRQVVTARLTQMLHYQTVTLSLFTFVSPTDEDWHLRPNVSYKFSDQVTLALGGNLFGGEDVYTLFGQFEENNNIYTRFRYNF